MKESMLLAAALAGAVALAVHADAQWVRLAASDSRAEARQSADFVCMGMNDELVVQQAIDRGCELRLCPRCLNASEGF